MGLPDISNFYTDERDGFAIVSYLGSRYTPYELTDIDLPPQDTKYDLPQIIEDDYEEEETAPESEGEPDPDLEMHPEPDSEPEPEAEFDSSPDPESNPESDPDTHLETDDESESVSDLSTESENSG